MPTYNYECESCGNHFEKFQSITADAIRKCPKCGEKVKKIITAGGGIIFKGTGFYQTDYKRCSVPAGSSDGKKNNSSECDSCPCSEE